MVKQIAGIPTYVINGHQEAYHLWRGLGVKERTLVHVDAHSDMWDGVRRTSEEEYSPDCGNYLLPSIKQNIITEIWWINPFSVSKYCLQLITSENIPATQNYQYSGGDKKTFWQNSSFWAEGKYGKTFYNFSHPRIVGEKYILSIDLDAFSCCTSIPQVQYPRGDITYEESIESAKKDYSSRISRVLKTLSFLKKPEMIIVAKSQEKPNNIFVHPRFVRPVKRELVRGLERIFSQ